MTDTTMLLLKVLCTYGLRMRTSDLSDRERAHQLRILSELEKEYGVQQVYYAIKDGMPEVWPFSDGRPYDATDLRSNILKARGAAGDKARRGESFHQALPPEGEA